MGVKISERSVDALTTAVELEGDLDLYSAAELNASLVRAIEVRQCLRLVVDLREVSSIDFSTIAIISQNARLLGSRHGTIDVLCREGEISRLLAKVSEAAGFDVRVDGDGDGRR